MRRWTWSSSRSAWGRLDAVNAFDADCAVITSIDLDHTMVPRPDRESIGREKAGIMRPADPVIVSDPMAPRSAGPGRRGVGADLWLFGRDFNSGDRQQWSWAGRGGATTAWPHPALRSANQLLNASGVAGGVRGAAPSRADHGAGGAQRLRPGGLPGRFQIVPGQPTLVLDAAQPAFGGRAGENLDQMGFIRARMRCSARCRQGLPAILQRRWRRWSTLALHRPARRGRQRPIGLLLSPEGRAPGAGGRSPARIAPSRPWLRRGGAADPTDRIVVFGSFYTVGGVLKDGMPAFRPHLLATWGQRPPFRSAAWP